MKKLIADNYLNGLPSILLRYAPQQTVVFCEDGSSRKPPAIALPDPCHLDCRLPFLSSGLHGSRHDAPNIGHTGHSAGVCIRGTGRVSGPLDPLQLEISGSSRHKKLWLNPRILYPNFDLMSAQKSSRLLLCGKGSLGMGTLRNAQSGFQPSVTSKMRILSWAG